MNQKQNQPPIIDYEGSQYRTDFWEGQGREYEDAVEQMLISRILPNSGEILMEAGAGFGRLAELYGGYSKVVLVDYSLSLLEEAKQQWGKDNRFTFVAANLYHLPFVDELIDAIVMVRVMHHLKQPSLALEELERVLQGQGVAILEYANKRNLKSIIRYGLRRQSWSPFDRHPYEFANLNFDFHPDWMSDRLQQSGLSIQREWAISHFRLAAIKHKVSPKTLARLDMTLGPLGARLKLSPSIVVRCIKKKPRTKSSGFFRCPACGGVELQENSASLQCQGCGNDWRIINGIYDFRFPR
ncbi:MAG TPA: class I SAM-dependent methyltransferase [Caldilineae bacterium]|nr:class I SAM-dependent methyltransferase [Caldilineae bacterium]